MTSCMNTRSSLQRLMSAAGFCLALLAGCAETTSRLDSRTRGSDRTIPTITSDELEQTVEHSDRPVVVEFGVPAGCYRCNDMRPHYDRLAETFSDGVHFVRVDFNTASHVASKFGATVCPSYVVFAHGNPVACCQYPTSADILAREIEQAAHEIAEPAQFASEVESLQ